MRLINSKKCFSYSAVLALLCIIINLLQLNSCEIVVVLPISYLLCVTLLRKAFFNSSYSLMIGFVSVLLFIRLVLLPFLNLLDGYYYTTVQRLGTSIFEEAVFLCSYDSLIIGVFVFLLTNGKFLDASRVKPITKRLYGSTFNYILFILFALVIVLTIGRHMHLFDFALKPVGGDYERNEESLDALTLLVRQIASSGTIFAFFILTEYCRKKYFCLSQNKSILLNTNILFALLMVCLITGERRTSQVYTAFACAWTLCSIYTSESKKIIKYITSCALVVLIMMTIYKHFYAFLYDSYYQALMNGDSSSILGTGSIDSYFYGVDTLARNVKFSNTSSVPFYTFFYDILRNFFGVNFFVPRNVTSTSEAYNLFIYMGEKSNGYLLGSCGYGHIYFGFLFAPIISCFNLICLRFLEKKLRLSRSIEMTYIWAILFMRFCFGVLGALPPLLNMSSRYLTLNGIVYLFGRFGKK